MRRQVWVFVLAACAGAAGAQERTRPNVLLVTVDALRADRVTPALTPTIHALAARGLRFGRAYTHAPITLPSHASILTGLFPPTHGVRNNGFRLDNRVITLPETLREAGYATGAFVGASALDARFGLDQGFAVYDDGYNLLQAPVASAAFRHGTRSASDTLAAAATWIERQPGQWFAWTHLRDPHAPYQSYDRAVASADAALAAFFARLSGAGVPERTLIVVTADHGESLDEHGERTHGLFAYEGTLRVPLVFAGPGVSQAFVARVSGHVDVMPTVLQLIGLAGPASDGQSLAPFVRGGEVPERPIYFEALDAALMRGGAPLTGVLEGRWKFIDLPLAELYDVVADSRESSNRAADEPRVATRLRDETVRLRTGAVRADITVAAAEPEARARLRSLGYVGAASWRLGASRAEDDPKRLLPLHRAYESALEQAAGDPDGAIRQFEMILAQRPDFAAAVDALAALLIDRGRIEDATALLSEARAGGLRHRALAERLGAALLAVRNAHGALAVLRPIVDADGGAVDARYLLARAYAATGDPKAAVAELEAALRVDPTYAAASALLKRLRDRK